MYYLFASLIVGAFIGGSALMTTHPDSMQPTEATFTSYEETAASPIVDNEALSAEAVVSLSI
jgi:hypothetical protein